jgi:hypothetical protein
MISTKPGVDLNGMKAELVYALLVADGVFSSLGKACTVTSVCDGKHGRGSLHYVGLAMDLRTRHLTENEQREVKAEIAKRLGEQFDVVLEKTHLHIEFNPK